MLREKAIGPAGIGDERSGSRNIRLDCHEGELGGKEFRRVCKDESTVRTADLGTVDSEL